MKKIWILFAVLTCLLVVPCFAEEMPLRGVWVSTVYGLDYPSSPGSSAAKLEQEADRIVENARKWGMNAIFLQVRPAADALYRSETEPWSVYLSGKQGQPADGDFDPLAYFLQICHENGIALHAWINPYRITRNSAETREQAFSLLCENHPARTMEDCVVFHSDGCLYYDPGKPQVQEMLLDIARELLTDYAVDGLHMDDYFYPGQDFEDSETYAEYGQSFSSIGDFRRYSVDTLVEQLCALTHEVRPEAVFGISPAGIWATAEGHPLGANTRGGQSYYDHYADSRRWVRENLVDYIMPQLYWEIGANSGDFQTMLDWWCDTARDTDVALYIGLAAYRSAAAEEGSVWFGSDELERQLDRIERSDTANGAVFFRYGSLLGQPIEELLSETAPLPKVPAKKNPIWPEVTTLLSPDHSTAALSGEQLSLTCSAPRGSQVTAFWGGRAYRTLKPDLCGEYHGAIRLEQDETDYKTSPLLICTQKHGMVFVRLTTDTATAVSGETTPAVTVVQSNDDNALHALKLSLTDAAAADYRRSGDVVTLHLKNCTLSTEITDAYFRHISTASDGQDLWIRLVLPDDGQKKQLGLDWSEQSITLWIHRNP